MDREGSKKAIGGFILRISQAEGGTWEPVCEGSSSQNHSHSPSPSGDDVEKRVAVNVHASMVDCVGHASDMR
jgi:hypothetical protein